MRPAPHRARGAAVLLAMLVLTLVSTLAAAMVWQQSRAIHLEAAERARTQAGWILTGAVDWAREVWRRNARDSPAGQQPWDMEVAEGRMSAFLAADREQSADVAVDAFLSGRMEDAQSRYNLRNLVDGEGKLRPAELATLRRLFEALALPDSPDALAAALVQAWGGRVADPRQPPALAPGRLEQLAWLGVGEATLARLRPFVDVLPEPTPLNLNTAPREVIYAVLDGLDMGSASRLVRQPGNRFRTLEEVRAQELVPAPVTLDPSRVAVTSNHAWVVVTVRLDERAMSETALLQRRGAGAAADVRVVRRERQAGVVQRP